MSKTIKVCFCGKKKVNEDPSDWRFGFFLWIALAVSCSILLGLVLGVVAAGIPSIVYMICILFNVLKGHTLKCAFRKSVIDTFDIFSLFSAVN